MEIEKISETKARFTTPQPDKVEEVGLKSLLAEKESLQMQIDNQIKYHNEFISAKESAIAEIDFKIAECEKVGIKVEVVIPK